MFINNKIPRIDTYGFQPSGAMADAVSSNLTQYEFESRDGYKWTKHKVRSRQKRKVVDYTLLV